MGEVDMDTCINSKLYMLTHFFSWIIREVFWQNSWEERGVPVRILSNTPQPFHEKQKSAVC
ncbi:MAG: hypothetical protein G01um101466_3 [Parcubacteria group bacterium Gr01-1014_66]|nr:MAG: hypothetical protein G01um101466_3 [Parcubacteria group bacterium Gr01-1014_66]